MFFSICKTVLNYTHFNLQSVIISNILWKLLIEAGYPEDKTRVHRFRNRWIILFADNKIVKYTVNKNSSSCKNCVVLIQLIVLESLKENITIFVKYVKSRDNVLLTFCHGTKWLNLNICLCRALINSQLLCQNKFELYLRYWSHIDWK